MGQILETMVLSGDGTTAHNELQHDVRGKALLIEGTTIPLNGGAGYAVGARFIKTNAIGGQATEWRNHGTAAACQFRPCGPVMGYGFYLANTKAFASGTAGLVETLPAAIVSTDIALASHATSDDNDQLISVITGTNTVTITNQNDPLAAHSAQYATLRNGCIPDYDIFAAGTYTTVGGAAAEAITISGALASDIALVQIAVSADTMTISKAVMTANTLTVTSSADPSTSHAYHVCILRPRGSFKPSHYVFAAGKVTTVGGAAAEAITVTGVKTTDAVIMNYAVTNDTDSILKVVPTAGIITATLSADPITAHALSYAVLRAY
jgi:hypothetical protein